jgi:Uma2 family endonuclease
MATFSPTHSADDVVEIQITPGGLDRYLQMVGEVSGNPLIKSFDGSILLVSPGVTHERSGTRLRMLIQSVAVVLGVEFKCYGSALYRSPGDDAGVMPDSSFYFANARRVQDREIDLAIDPPPDLVVEVVVSHSAVKAMGICRALNVPEVWVFDVPRQRLTFFHRKKTGEHAGRYEAAERSLAIPVLTARETFERVADPVEDDGAYIRKIRKWARSELLPRHRPRRPRK